MHNKNLGPIEFNVNIATILLNVDESILSLQFGDGYSIHKINYINLPFKDDITDKNNNILCEYWSSQIVEENNIYFICLLKNDVLDYIPSNIGEAVGINITPSKFDEYVNKQFEILNTYISKFNIFKSGDIGIQKVFYKFSIFNGIVKNTQKRISWISDAKTILKEKYSLTTQEIKQLSAFISTTTPAFTLLKGVIDTYSYGFKFIEAAKTYEQLTTVLEMLFLEANEQGKKQVLSKRISVLLEDNDSNILSLYFILCNSYRLRSESLHEGNYLNINYMQVDELSNITRKVIKKYIEFADIQLSLNPNITFMDIKLTMIYNLKQIVEQKNSISFFPR